MDNYSEFILEFRNVFDHEVQWKEAANQFFSLRQGSCSVTDYSIDFRVLAARSRWIDAALRGVFHRGLADAMKDELAVKNEPNILNSLIVLAINLENRLRKNHQEKSNCRPLGSIHSPLNSQCLRVSASSPHVHISPTFEPRAHATRRDPSNPGGTLTWYLK